MFDEPEEAKSEFAADPAERAKEKSDEFRMHAEFCAVYEGHRKFDAALLPNLDADLARDLQKTVGRLAKAKEPGSPILPPAVVGDATELLALPESRHLTTNDYHIYRRPGEVMIVRWLAGPEVASFYERLQAHYDAAMNGYKEDERQANAWRADKKLLAYLDALDGLEVKMADRYLRDVIKKHDLVVLSTQTADEVNIAYLAGDVMNVEPADLVGHAFAPPEDNPSESDLAWFFKLFALRGVVGGVERMCFFTYLQKTQDEDEFSFDE